MPTEKKTLLVKRYFKKGDFNPRSRDQLLSFMESRGFSGGAPSEKTGKPTVDKKVLENLGKKDPLFKAILDYKAIDKVKSTYIVGSEKRMDKESRLHPNFKHKPSTMRLSCVNPNLQNIVADKEDSKIAAGFRDCIVAAPGCSLIEADFAAIEALLVGWLIRDPNFIRLAKLGIHGWHASHILGKPVSLNASDEEVGKKLKAIKASDPVQYNRSKITIYGSLYSQGPYGLHKTWPDTFPTISSAEHNQALLFSICPALKQWHDETRVLVHKQGFLGGGPPGEWPLKHPYGFRHWFWDVFGWNPKKQDYSLGGDSKRVLAYGPQSIGYGIISDSSQRIAKRTSKFFFGKTPIRALIHDSIFAEVEDRYLDEMASIMFEEMNKEIPYLPMPEEWGFGKYLRIGVSIKAGKNWGSYHANEKCGISCEHDFNPEGMKELEPEIGVASDTAVRESDEEDEQD